MEEDQQEFFDIWDMPHCIGAIDGKYIAVECPANDGSIYCYYKSFLGLVFLAVCDAKYTFTLIYSYIGSDRSNNDCGSLASLLIWKKFDDNKMNLYFAENLAGFSSNPLNYFLVVDETLPPKS